ncbi:MAG: endonuclease [Tenuifilaceae bacterium]
MLKSFFFSALFLLSIVTFSQIPAGYYSTAEGKSGAVLKSSLYNIIKGHTERTYTNLWTDFQSTDKKANGKVWDMYSDKPGQTPAYEYTFISDQCGNYSGEGSCYNREHSFPKSWFNDGTPMYSDLFHLYPTDGYVNGKRSNYPFGEVGAASWTSTNGSKLGTSSYTGYSGVVFEPIDDYKGDFARSYFYMVTRYENVITTWPGSDMFDGSAFPAFTIWAKNMLLEWSQQDPVSQKEIDRNNAVYSIQNNRNPYIDHPEYANAVWGTGTINVLPTITNISINPSNPITGQTIKISATIADSDGTILEAYINWGTTSGSITTRVNMTLNGNIFEANLPLQTQATIIYYIVNAKDNSGGLTSSVQSSFTVVANNPPSITNISFNPTNPLTGESVKVSATITDSDGTILESYIKWGTTSEALTNQISMTLNGGVYEATIPSQSQAGTIYISVNAKDNVNALTTVFSNYTVSSGGTNTQPSIANIIFNPQSPITGQSVEVSATITDSDGTIQEAYIYWGTTSGGLTNLVSMSLNGGVFKATIPAQNQAGTIYISVNAKDNVNALTTVLSNYSVSSGGTNSLPIISNITINPQNPVTGQFIIISAGLSDLDGTIQEAYVNWGTTSGGVSTRINMSFNGSVYEAIIPNQTQAGSVFYTVNVKDNSGALTTSSQSSIIILQNTIPSIVQIQINPQNPSVNQSITISATITDANGPIKEAFIKWGFTSTTNRIDMSLNSGLFIGTIPFQSQTGTIYFTINAKDNSNELATVQSNFTISPITNTLIEKNQTILIYPNPARGFISVEVQNNLTERIEISNIIGERLISKPFKGEKELIDISNLNPGIYFVNVFGNSFRSITRIVVY